MWFFKRRTPQKRQITPANVHVTWILGRDNKISSLRANSLWFIGDDPDNPVCSLPQASKATYPLFSTETLLARTPVGSKVPGQMPTDFDMLAYSRERPLGSAALAAARTEEGARLEGYVRALIGESLPVGESLAGIDPSAVLPATVTYTWTLARPDKANPFGASVPTAWRDVEPDSFPPKEQLAGFKPVRLAPTSEGVRRLPPRPRGLAWWDAEVLDTFARRLGVAVPVSGSDAAAEARAARARKREEAKKAAAAKTRPGAIGAAAAEAEAAAAAAAAASSAAVSLAEEPSLPPMLDVSVMGATSGGRATASPPLLPPSAVTGGISSSFASFLVSALRHIARSRPAYDRLRVLHVAPAAASADTSAGWTDRATLLPMCLSPASRTDPSLPLAVTGTGGFSLVRFPPASMADAQALPLRSADAFHVVLATGSLDAVECPSCLVAELARWAAAEGIVLLAFPFDAAVDRIALRPDEYVDHRAGRHQASSPAGGDVAASPRPSSSVLSSIPSSLAASTRRSPLSPTADTPGLPDCPHAPASLARPLRRWSRGAVEGWLSSAGLIPAVIHCVPLPGALEPSAHVQAAAPDAPPLWAQRDKAGRAHPALGGLSWALNRFAALAATALGEVPSGDTGVCLAAGVKSK